jgi:hypothetical protein
MPKLSANPTQDIVFLLLWHSMLKLDPIELIVALSVKIILHSLIRSKAFMIFAYLSPATEAIPDVLVAVKDP